MNLIELLSPSGTKEINITEAHSDTLISVRNLGREQEDKEGQAFELTVNVAENCDNANVTVLARYETHKKQRKFFTLSVFLKGKNQTAKIDVRGISDDKSLLSFNGGGIVAKNSEQCSVNITQKIHLFSEKSKANATPVLRVETDNILSASHSASVSPFSKDIFFYMETRGISKKDAKQLLRKGLLFPNDEV